MNEASQESEESADDEERRGTVLFVVTNHTELGDSGDETGYYLSEVAHPWAEIVDAGYDVDFVSPQGGSVAADPKSMDLDDPVNERFWQSPGMQTRLEATLAPDEVNSDDYEAIFFTGGHGTMWDFADNERLAELTAQIWEAGGAVAAVCHGPAGLLNVELSSGALLVAGREVTGFTNAEERAVALDEVVPFMLESQLRVRGAEFVGGDDFEENVVVDGRLVTGQNPASAHKLGQQLIEVMESSP